MHNFSVWHDVRVNQKIEADLAHIKAAVLTRMDRVEALVLTGGFSRGEGGVIITDETIRPINDYDVTIIVSKRPKGLDVNGLRKELADALGIWWVDFAIYTRRQLPHRPLSIYYYDLKYAGYVFYGDRHILDEIPAMDAAQMPFYEGEVLFSTRLWCFLGPFSTRFVTDGLPDVEASFFLSHQLSKAILACMDVLLLRNRAYHSSYQERFLRFSALYADQKQWVAWCAWALDFKLKPTYASETQCDVAMYFKVKDFYFSVMQDFLGCFYNRPFVSWEAYAAMYQWCGVAVFQRLYRMVRSRSLRTERQRKVHLAQVFIAAAYGQEGVKTDFFHAGMTLLRRLTKQPLLTLSWEEARALVAELRMTL